LLFYADYNYKNAIFWKNKKKKAKKITIFLEAIKNFITFVAE